MENYPKTIDSIIIIWYNRPMSNKTTPEFTYEVLTQEDPETGDLILPIPPELMKQMNWAEGDELSFDQDDQGRWIISKK